jgi:acetyl esterase/lipase
MPSLPSYFFRNYMRAFRFIASRLSPQTFRKIAASSERFPLTAKGVKMEQVTANNVRCEWLIPQKAPCDKVILYLHGGGWIMGWYNSHRLWVSHLAKRANLRVLAVDYRLAPENPFPAPLEDCLSAYRWLLEKDIAPKDIVIAGDSAGGNMTITLMLALRQAKLPLPGAAVCLSPALEFEPSEQSLAKTKDPVLTPDWLRSMLKSYAGDTDLQHPLLNPLYGDLSGLPPLLIQVGDQEILLNDAKRLAEKAAAEGVAVEIEVWEEMWHVWQMLAPYLPEARQALDKIAGFVKTHL